LREKTINIAPLDVSIRGAILGKFGHGEGGFNSTTSGVVP
jgi:hypothetical protein